MGYMAICDCCGKELPPGQYLHVFIIGTPNYMTIDEVKWGEVCDDCYKLLRDKLVKNANWWRDKSKVINENSVKQ